MVEEQTEPVSNETVVDENVVKDVEVVVKRKKGRPRKEVVENVPAVPEEKKKRGRKKKEVVVEEIKKKKKRGRKAAVKYFSSSIRKKIPLTTVLQDKNNYILHLDIQDNNSEKDDFELELNDSIEGCELEDSVIFEKLKEETHENILELQKEYDDLLKDEELILSEINDETLTELYEKRIEFREHQDTILVNKLETIHKENDIYNKINLISFSNEKVNVELTETEQKEHNKKRGFFEIMHQFLHTDNWLTKTDISCWWCCHPFSSVPVGLPIKYDNNKQKFHVKGVFCSFSCMLAYKNDNPVYKTKRDLVNFLYTKLTGTFLLDIHLVPAPPRCTLKMFGGELDIEEFRNSFKENKMYKMVQYPMFICNDYIEEVDIENIKRVNQNVFSDNTVNNKIYNLDEKRIEDAKNRLSQIEKTTITLGNTIDKFIKIT